MAEDDITALDLRLERLEETVGKSRIQEQVLGEAKAKSEEEMPTSMIADLKKCYDLHASHKAEFQVFDRFFETYEKLETYLHSSATLIDILSQPQKEDVVLCAQDDIRKVVSMLEVMTKLEPLIEKPIVDHLPSMKARANKLEARAYAQLDEAAGFHKEVDATLDAYTQVIDLLSNKFLYWNKKVTEWEYELDKREGHA